VTYDVKQIDSGGLYVEIVTATDLQDTATANAELKYGASAVSWPPIFGGAFRAPLDGFD
jgi:hypothetical protein